MKPSWDNAPDWAKYLAMDEDGTWWWWEDKPKMGIRYWYSYDSNSEHAVLPCWSDTLEVRPSEETSDE